MIPAGPARKDGWQSHPAPGSSSPGATSPIQQSPGKKLQLIPVSLTDGKLSGSRDEAGTCWLTKVLMEQAQLYLPGQSCTLMAQVLSPNSSLAAGLELSIQGKFMPEA